MKKMFVLVSFMIAMLVVSMAQNYTATIAIGDVDISKLKPGDDVMVPVKLVEKSGGLFSILQFYMDYDHSLLKWKGSYKEPLAGVKAFHVNMQYAPELGHSMIMVIN